MRVGELIRRLQTLDQTLEVVIPYADDPEYYVPLDRLNDGTYSKEDMWFFRPDESCNEDDHNVELNAIMFSSNA